MEKSEAVFSVLDTLGLVQLVKRRGDLGGSMALRAVRGCAPLFEGNAFGFQLVLRHPIHVRRSPSGTVVEIDPAYGNAMTAAHQAALLRLAEHGFLPPESVLATAFAEHFVRIEEKGPGEIRVRLWTGLCVRPDPGVWLRVSSTANRRNRFIEVEEQFIPDDAFVPLLLTIDLAPNAPDRVSLVGEIGTLAPVAPGASVETVSLAEAPEIGIAHAAFYDETYFQTKRGKVTQKYRQLRPAQAPQDEAPARCRVITMGPLAHAVIPGPVPCVALANLVPFKATYDGYTVALEPDPSRLQAGASQVEQSFAQALGPTFQEQHSRAVLYFSKHFTSHPSGEPHFFVKPWVLIQTPPGWACLLEGLHGDGFDVLRGIVNTDVFHAVPAVFQVYRVGEPIRVGLGETLLRVIPIPRRLLDAGFREVRL